MRKHFGYFDHECDLPVAVDSYVLELPPYLPKYKRWFLSLKKSIIVDETSARTRKFFRSYATVTQERKRHAEGPYSKVIHPFSKFALIKEKIVCILWIISFFFDPFGWSFLMICQTGPILLTIHLILDSLFIINVILSCFTGYYVPLTKEVVLSPKKIIKHKALTFLIPEFLSSIPYKFILETFHTIKANESRLYAIPSLRLLRCMRLFDMTRYLRNIFDELKVSEAVSTTIIVFLEGFLLIHWCGCVLFFTSISYFTLDKLPEESWLKENIEHLTVNDAEYCAAFSTKFLDLFVLIVIKATCHFFGASEGYGDIPLTLEKLMCAFVMILGFIFSNYAMAKVLELFGSVNISESKYEELLYQVLEYVHSKNLSDDMRKRMRTYYEYKFQKKYFKEDEIMSTLSEHLRCEVFLHTCKTILERVPLLQGMSRAVVGSVIGYLKSEIFLPNDVVIKYGEPLTKMYWVSHGTLAVYYGAEMIEILHFEDGDHFGDDSIKAKGRNASLSVVALEITEIFTLSRKDIKHCTTFMKEMTEKVTRIGREKAQMYVTLAHMMKSGESQNRIIANLRKGRILEKDKWRKKRPETLVKTSHYFVRKLGSI